MWVQRVMTRRVAGSMFVMSTMSLNQAVTFAPAQADDQRRCVSQREYNDVKVYKDRPVVGGWRQARVANHFDIIGKRIRRDYVHGDVDEVWQYRKCSAWGPGGWYVAIWYTNYLSE